jgi:HD-GYP domain-containing protein (c-di-GMP phosphodiesterase class II)
MLAVADVVDALTADRPYRAAMPIAKALEIMAADVDAAFDPACFAALRRRLVKLASPDEV